MKRIIFSARWTICGLIAVGALVPAASAQAATINPPTVSCHVNRGWQGYYSDLTVRAEGTVQFRSGRYHFNVPRCQVAYAAAAEISSSSGFNPLHLNSNGDGHIHIEENGRGGFDGGNWRVHVDWNDYYVTATQGHLKVEYASATTSVWGTE